MNYDLPDVASPVVTSAGLYMPTSVGVGFCIDPATGEMIYEMEFEDAVYASPIAVGSRIYILDMKGRMTVLNDNGSPEPAARSELGEDTVATPAFVSGRIYMRGLENLYCVEEKE